MRLCIPSWGGGCQPHPKSAASGHHCRWLDMLLFACKSASCCCSLQETLKCPNLLVCFCLILGMCIHLCLCTWKFVQPPLSSWRGFTKHFMQLLELDCCTNYKTWEFGDHDSMVGQVHKPKGSLMRFTIVFNEGCLLSPTISGMYVDKIFDYI